MIHTIQDRERAMTRSFLLLFSLLLGTIVHAEFSPCASHHCVAVIDAGSTGSRLHLYSYDVDASQTPQHITEFFSKQVRPGLSTVPLNQSAINQYLTDLFANTPTTSMPLYFYSTAGMRLLPHDQQESYYEKLKQWFASQSQWQLISARTIQGKEEGVYGWLAINYELGTLNSSSKSLVGVMDTGGASVQITFPLTNPQYVNSEDQILINIYGRQLQLYSHSFLGLGSVELEHQFFEVADCFSNNYPLSNGTLGHGNATSCEKEVTTLVNSVHHVDKIVKPVLDSNPVKQWYALGGLSAIAQDKSLSFDKSEFTISALTEKANKNVCQKDWTFLNNQDPKNEYLYGYCLKASYFYSLLTEGYGINPNESIHYFSKENHFKDWTLGVVLHQEQIGI